MQVDARFRFDNFVVGSGNRLAIAAARAVSESPGAVYNPLFVYSGAGLGKTHIMGAIGNHVQQKQKELHVEYVALDAFVEQLHAAIGSGEIERFKQRYQRVDVLLIDDVQFLTGHLETQTELLRLLNTMVTGGRQIVMTSDRPPMDIADVDERLITKLSGGLIVDIAAPDYETRVAILRAKCEDRGVKFRAGVIEELARLEFTNVRELQGALNRCVASQTLGGKQISADDVLGLVGDVLDSTPKGTPSRGFKPDEFQNFLSDVANAVAQHVEGWKVRIAEAMQFWSGQGYKVTPLEHMLNERKAPANWEQLLRGFNAAVERLHLLEQLALQSDPALAGNEIFRDPQRLKDAEAFVQKVQAASTPPPGPSSAFTRATFEVGTSNQLAAKACEAVVEEPGQKYNPLFIHGPSGVGKTHLLNAAGNDLVNAGGNPSLVACVSAQIFMDELIAALQEGTVDRWRARYRAVDALLIDDVQFVAGKERTQEELFHVFNALYAEGKQLVFASDRPPKELDGLEDRLRSRFEGGLVVEMHSPDRELRQRLYKRFLSAADPEARDELLMYLADRPASSVREVIGTVNRLLAAADLANVELSLAVARAELEPEGTTHRAVPSVRAASDTFFLDDEKVVWEWSDVGSRLIEELR